jgi:hypothetical protein
MKPGLLMRLWAWLSGGRAVWLSDYENKLRFSIERVRPDGLREAPVYWVTGVGSCILLEGGKVDPSCKSSYVKRWGYWTK